MPRITSREGKIQSCHTSCPDNFLPFSGSLDASDLVNLSSRDPIIKSPSEELPMVIASIEGWAVGDGGVNIIVEG